MGVAIQSFWLVDCTCHFSNRETCLGTSPHRKVFVPCCAAWSASKAWIRFLLWRGDIDFKRMCIDVEVHLMQIRQKTTVHDNEPVDKNLCCFTAFKSSESATKCEGLLFRNCSRVARMKGTADNSGACFDTKLSSN